MVLTIIGAFLILLVGVALLRAWYNSYSVLRFQVDLGVAALVIVAVLWIVFSPFRGGHGSGAPPAPAQLPRTALVPEWTGADFPPPGTIRRVVAASPLTPQVVLVRAEKAQPPRETMAVWSRANTRQVERQERRARARAQARAQKRDRTLDRLRNAITRNVRLATRAWKKMHKKDHPKFHPQVLGRGISYLREVRDHWHDHRVDARTALKNRANQAPPVSVYHVVGPQSAPVTHVYIPPPPTVTRTPSNGGSTYHPRSNGGSTYVPKQAPTPAPTPKPGGYCIGTGC
jgi:hypothetical protein